MAGLAFTAMAVIPLANLHGSLVNDAFCKHIKEILHLRFQHPRPFTIVASADPTPFFYYRYLTVVDLDSTLNPQPTNRQSSPFTMADQEACTLAEALLVSTSKVIIKAHL